VIEDARSDKLSRLFLSPETGATRLDDAATYAAL
jgi:hypothetical protein